MRLALVNTKGGVGKTTTAIYLAAGFSTHGRTLLVDCDPQQSAELWAETVDGLPFEHRPLAVTDLPKRLPAVAVGYDHVVIDTPPGNEPIIRSAVLAADVVLVPVTPSGLEVTRLRPTFELLAELEPQHAVGAGVLLTKMRYSTNSARGVREVLEGEYGYPVMATEIPLLESYVLIVGWAPADLGQYAVLVKELLS
jgi:chromosome partitioning protein